MTITKTKKKLAKKTKVRPIGKLKEDLDRVYSLYIRLKYAKDGLCRCVTCGKVLHFKDIQNGHYESRIHTALRWDDRNCHPQCMPCNVFKHGNMPEYALFMIKTYGEDILNQLSREKHQSIKLERLWLIAEIKKYKEILKTFNNL
jgi:hypothetical protein